MSAVKTALVVTAVLGGGIALLFAGGVLTLKKNDPVARSPRKSTDDGDSKSAFDDMDSLAYLGAIPTTDEDRGKDGVTIYVEGKAHEGFTVINPCGWGQGAKRASAGLPWLQADLISAKGETLHTWKAEAYRGERRSWAIVRVDDEAAAYTVVADRGVIKINWENELVWQLDGTYHHDLWLTPEHGVLALTEQSRTIEHEGADVKILDHGIAFISPSGTLERTLWFFDSFGDMEPFRDRVSASLQKQANKKRKRKGARRGFDVFHANAVKLLEKDYKDLWSAGDILVSFRHLDLVAVIASADGRVKWSWGPGELDHQHDPSVVDNGNILVFDNGVHRKHSRVIEFVPDTGEVVWEYKAPKPRSFFSVGRGLAQKLPNGNIVIASSNQGRAFELSPDGEMVWEYYMKYRIGDARVPFRMNRLTGAPLAAVRKKLGLPPEEPAKAGDIPAAPPEDSAGSPEAADGKKPDAEPKPDAAAATEKAPAKVDPAPAKADPAPAKADPAPAAAADEKPQPSDPPPG